MSGIARVQLRATPAAIGLLTAISTLGSFATSVYLPSMPAIGVEFAATPAAVQATLTTFLASFAAVQLVFGPLSDRYGRRPVLAWGFAIYVAGSLACAMAASVGLLAAARVLQAAGACAGLVVGRAVVRDAFDGPVMTRVMAALAVASGVIPAAAPLIGGLIQQWQGWRVVFLLTALVGVAVAALAMAKLPETNHRRLGRLDLRSLLGGYGPMLGSAHFMGCAAVNAGAFAALYAFLSGSPHVMIEVIGVAPAEYGLYPPIAIIGAMIGGSVTGRLAGRWHERRLAGIGIGCLLAGTSGMLLFPLAGILRPASITLCMFAYSAGMGVVMPVFTAAAIRPFRERAGTASALIGFLQMAAGAGGSALVGLLQPLDVLAFPAAMVAAAGLGAAVFLGLRRRIDFH